MNILDEIKQKDLHNKTHELWDHIKNLDKYTDELYDDIRWNIEKIDEKMKERIRTFDLYTAHQLNIDIRNYSFVIMLECLIHTMTKKHLGQSEKDCAFANDLEAALMDCRKKFASKVVIKDRRINMGEAKRRKDILRNN